MLRPLKCLCLTLLALSAIPQESMGTEIRTGTGLFALPENGGARRFEVVSESGLQLRKFPAADATETGLLPAGTVLANLGCSTEAGRLWCAVRPFRGGAAGFVPADGLLPAVGLDGEIIRGEDDSEKRVKKRDFDASGTIACAQEKGERLGECETRVARGTGGDATLAATFPNGFTRRLYFVHGEFVKASATMSGAGRDTEGRIEADRHIIRVDDQRYEIPEVLIFGE